MISVYIQCCITNTNTHIHTQTLTHRHSLTYTHTHTHHAPPLGFSAGRLQPGWTLAGPWPQTQDPQHVQHSPAASYCL